MKIWFKEYCGVWGGGGGGGGGLWCVFFFNFYVILLYYSNSFQTHRICCKQYLDSIWIVLGCMGVLGGGVGGANTVPTDSTGNFLSPQTWFYRDMRLPQLSSVVLWLTVFTQLWNLQDLLKTTWRLDLNSIWEYGGARGAPRSGDISRHRKFPKSCTSLYQRSPRHAKHHARYTPQI